SIRCALETLVVVNKVVISALSDSNDDNHGLLFMVNVERLRIRRPLHCRYIINVIIIKQSSASSLPKLLNMKGF
ncbi:hypothetical protein GJ496_009412, partial [Pomphorhynchus laevis]